MMCGFDLFGMSVCWCLCCVCGEGVLLDDVRILFFWSLFVGVCVLRVVKECV